MILEFDSVAMMKGDIPLFAPIDLRLHAGEQLALMGPSGIGKSSLLGWLCGMLPEPLNVLGKCRLGGVELSQIPVEKRQIGILFQDDLLFDHLDVAGNLGFAIPESTPKKQRLRLIDEALFESGLQGFGPRRIQGLSGGERKRIATMRALLSQPRLLLLDEPFSALDHDQRLAFRQEVLAGAKRIGAALLLVTHDTLDVGDLQVLQLCPPGQISPDPG